VGVWIYWYVMIDASGKTGQVVGNIVSEWSQILALVLFTKYLVEKGSEVAAEFIQTAVNVSRPGAQTPVPLSSDVLSCPTTVSQGGDRPRYLPSSSQVHGPRLHRRRIRLRR
jgi:hypothetical protein